MNQPSNSKKSSSANPLFLVVDVGTTNIKGFLFDHNLTIVQNSVVPGGVQHPMPGWVEQDAEGLYRQVTQLITQLGRDYAESIVAIGLTGQRESVVAWNPTTGRPLYPVINWQDKRASDFCRDINHTPAHRQLVRQKTGLVIDPYFSAPKLHWLLNSVNLLGAACGTLDSWLLYKLTNERVHRTDRTNASRTLLYNIQTLAWDSELCQLFGIPEELLPEVLPSFADFGTLHTAILGRPIPIKAVVGDQQASLYAAGTQPGIIKLTYGTGIFAMKILANFELRDNLLTTLAIGYDNEALYALEDKIENAAQRVMPALDDPKQLDVVLSQLALETVALLQPMLDADDKQILADGGIARDGIIIQKQNRLLGGQVQVVQQPTTEGTALGIAMLLRDRMA